MKEIEYKDILNRIGFFMNKENKSARALSLDLDYSEQFMKRILNESVELKVRTLLDIFKILKITPQDFFYLGTEYNESDKAILEMFSRLLPDSKKIVIDLINKLK